MSITEGSKFQERAEDERAKRKREGRCLDCGEKNGSPHSQGCASRSMPTTTTSPKPLERKSDDIAAFGVVVKALETLPQEARSRILRAAAMLYGVTRAVGEEPLATPVGDSRDLG